MAKEQLETEIAASPDAVWAAVGNYGDLSFFPGVTGVRTEGEDRIVSAGQARIRERLLERDDARRVLRYSVTEGLPGLEHHEATVSVLPAGEGSKVVWGFEVLPDEMVPAMAKTYTAALDGLKNHLA